MGVFDELTPYIFEKDGIKIAFFGMQRVHFYSLREELTEKIRVLRQEEGVSAVVFTPHFGNEYATHHTNAQACLLYTSSPWPTPTSMWRRPPP